MNENQGTVGFASYLTMDEKSKSINSNFDILVNS